MKKIVLISLLIFGCISINAQVKYGPIVGVGYADNSYGKGVDLSLGAFVDFELLDRFGVRPEIIYSTKLGWDKSEESGITTKTTSNMKYVEIPLLVYFQLSSNLNMYIGPQFNSPLGGKTVDSYSGGNALNPAPIDDLKIDRDGHGGTGFVVGIEKNAFSRLKLGVRFSQFGYTSEGGGFIYDDLGNIIGTDSGVSNKVITIKATVRYVFDW